MAFSDSYLDSISLNRPYEWNYLPAVGTAGGILVGVDSIFFLCSSLGYKNLLGCLLA